MADMTLRQQDATLDGMTAVLEQQPSLPQQQVPTETSTQASPTSQRMPTYSNFNIQYNNHNDNITTATVNSTTTTATTSPTNRVLPMQQRNASTNLNGCSTVGTGHLRSGTLPATAVVENEIAGNIKVTGNEKKISYEPEVKRIPSHLPIPNGIKGNITNISNQLQQQSALHNRPLLQANVTKHTLASLVTPAALTYKITDLVEKATNKVSKLQQQTHSQASTIYPNKSRVKQCQTTALQQQQDHRQHQRIPTPYQRQQVAHAANTKQMPLPQLARSKFHMTITATNNNDNPGGVMVITINNSTYHSYTNNGKIAAIGSALSLTGSTLLCSGNRLCVITE
uniref:Uncharacterized protein n=1 Tax=Glossina pallidipes TaxID=7398 RepID=A0A1A9Z8I3_GLOPL